MSHLSDFDSQNFRIVVHCVNMVLEEKMDKPKHTPGPWMIAESNRAVYTEAPLSKQRTYIAELITNGDDNKNIALIAAAPEMLEALTAVAMTDGVRDLKVNGRSIQDMVDAAIAKAKGGTR